MIKNYINKKDNKKYYEVKNEYIGKNAYTGKEKRISKKGFKTKKEAMLYIAEKTQEFTKGNIYNNTMTFKDVYILYWEQYQLHVKKSTVIKNKRLFKSTILPTFSTVKVNNINLIFCQKFINQLAKKYSKGHIGNVKNLVSQVLDYAVKMELTKTNYMRYIKIPKTIEKIRSENYYNKKELIEFLEIVKNNYPYDTFLIFRILAFTGLRSGELRALKWKDINFKDKTITINKSMMMLDNIYEEATTKTKFSNRVIYLDNVTLSYLKQLRKEKKCISLDNHIFNIKCRYDYRLKWIYKDFPHLKKISIHGFRHTHATLLFESGVTAKDIQHRLGHANISTTLNIYTHITDEKRKDVSEKFNRFMNI